MKKTLFSVILFCVVTNFYFSKTYAQNKEQINIRNSDLLVGSKHIGEGVRRFLGNVIFEHNNALMYCDSADLYSKKNTLDA